MSKPDATTIIVPSPGKLDVPAPPEVIRRFEEVLESLPDSMLEHHRETIVKAFRYAAEAHAGQTRLSGDPYIVHPLEVMAILAELQVDTVTLLGALLHDVVEDTGITVEDVAREFWPVVALLVEGITKLKPLQYDTKSNEARQAEYFRKMLLSMAQDLRVILIKLADRLHNMRTLEAMPPKSRQRIALETIEIYAPLAHRFGIGRLKWELEDLSLKVLDNVAYRRIAERVAMKREEREAAIDEVVQPLRKRLEEEGMRAEVVGRAKHFYSIYNKIKRRGKSFEEILDLLAVRILVDTIPDCYRALGVVHNLFTPILERFSDYIAMPKANMYQSLHTKVIDKHGRTVEVQIRTYEMETVSEVGIAAHWRYKEDGGDTLQQDNLGDYYRWLRQVIEGSRDAESDEEFMKNLKINLFTDEIFVFTPRGKLIQLPKAATPVDFAFAVHTDIGLTTLGAKVNGKMVPLDIGLNNGDSVEILTSVHAKPSVDWLRFVKTSRARSKIRRYLKQAQFEESVRLGEELLSRELGKYRKKLTKQKISDLVSSFGKESPEAFFAALGAGDLSLHSVVKHLVGEEEPKREKKTAFLRSIKKENAGIRVKGVDNLMVNIASCCNPLPGDRILGFISKGPVSYTHLTLPTIYSV